MKNNFIIVLIAVACSCLAQNKIQKFEVQKSDSQWKKELTPEEYEVLREKGTERPFSGKYVNNFDKGVYVCAACNNLLFYSDSKFHSDCGWPSFDKAIKGSVIYVNDSSY